MRIIFQFVGGPLDGKTVVGVLGEQDEAERYYALSHHGRVGQRFRIASEYIVETLAQEDFAEEQPHHFQQHSYRVTDRIAMGDEVLIHARYLTGAEEAPGQK